MLFRRELGVLRRSHCRSSRGLLLSTRSAINRSMRWIRVVRSGIPFASHASFCFVCSHCRSKAAQIPKTPPSRNAMRQPMRVTSAGGSILVIPILTIEPSRIPAVRPAVNVPQARLTRLEGTCSLTNTQTPRISPELVGASLEFQPGKRVVRSGSQERRK
jgi:hypothetical protein